MAGVLKTIQGDCTRPHREGAMKTIIPHVVNDMGRWGSGFVNAITKRWGNGPQQAYYAWHQERLETFSGAKWEVDVDQLVDPFALGGLQIVGLRNQVHIANMVGQHRTIDDTEDDRPPIRYGALAKAMASVGDYAETLLNVQICCPKFGSDLAGGDWNVIEQLIREIWVDRGLLVNVYEFDPTAK